MKDIKRAYRKKALKLHPDVNKAPNAKEEFMECKQAYQTLLDGGRRAGDDRRDDRRGTRGGGWGRSAEGRGTSGTTSSSSTRDYYGEKRQQEQEDFYGLGDLFRDLENEWQKTRPANGEPKSLWEELADIGEEFVEFLEKNMPEAEARGREYSSSSYSDPGGSTRPSTPRPPPQRPPPPKKKSVSVDDELAEMKRRMGL